jgi:ElaB/YqjD/DUF883 family membrane-anchored ribosome-binding protein
MSATTDPSSPKSLDTISSDLAALRRDFATLLADLRAGPLTSAKTSAQQAAEQLSGRASDLYGQASAQAEKSAEAIAREVEERPLTTLVLAFSVGFIASRLLAR